LKKSIGGTVQLTSGLQADLCNQKLELDLLPDYSLDFPKNPI
jgi:hypothetical protein